MVNEVFDNIRRTYDLQELDDSFFPKKKVKKGILFPRMVTVVDRSEYQGRISLTNRTLDTVGEILSRKIELAGIERKDLPQVILKISDKVDKGKVKFSMVNDREEVIGLINYSAGVNRFGYLGSYISVGGGVEVVVLGEAIKTPGQFNALQQKL